MGKKFNSKAYYEMSKLQSEIEDKLNEAKKNRSKEEVQIYNNKLKIVNRCINSLYL